MKQLQINDINARIQTEHGIVVLVRELLNGDIVIALHAAPGQSFHILSPEGNTVKIRRI